MGKYKDRLNENSIPMADRILSLVNNLQPAGGGEDLQGTVTEQTEAINALMAMVSRKIAENNGGVDLSAFAGYTKMAVDYVTYSSKKASTIKHSHSLGVSPKAGMMLALDAVTENYGITFAVCSLNDANGSEALSSVRYVKTTGDFWGSVNGSCSGFSTEDIRFGSASWTSYYFIAGVTYVLLTWA